MAGNWTAMFQLIGWWIGEISTLNLQHLVVYWNTVCSEAWVFQNSFPFLMEICASFLQGSYSEYIPQQKYYWQFILHKCVSHQCNPWKSWKFLECKAMFAFVCYTCTGSLPQLATLEKSWLYLCRKVTCNWNMLLFCLCFGVKMLFSSMLFSTLSCPFL